MYSTLAQAHKLPLVPFLLDQVALNPALMQADGMHPNEGGQPLLLDNVWPKLEPLLRADASSGAGAAPPAADVEKNIGVGPMDRFWLPQYPPSVPADIDPFEIDSLKSLIEDACERYADRIAYYSMGSSITYRELELRSRAFGAGCSTAPGSRAATASRSCCPTCCSFRSRCSARCAPA